MVMALIRIQNIPVYFLTPSTTCSYHSFLFCLFLASVRFCVNKHITLHYLPPRLNNVSVA